MLFFIGTYFILDSFGIGDPSVETRNKTVEEIVAVLSNEDSSQFVRGLSNVFSLVGTLGGEVDIINHYPDGRFSLSGWAIDRKRLDDPLDIFLVVPEKVVFATSTGKNREDVNKALNLPESVRPGFFDVFDYRLDCKFNEKDPYIVVVNQKREFALLKPAIRVTGC